MPFTLADELEKAMTLPCPIRSRPYAIEMQWIDYNGHFNMAYYNVLFDRDSDVALSLVGLGPEYIKRTDNSYFTLEAHISYLRELRIEDAVVIETQLLDYDTKRLHYVQTMLHVTEGWKACVSENIVMHVDMKTKRSSPFPADVLLQISRACAMHKSLSIPPQVGHKIGIPKKI
jgi:acyl-CoA thioester hydrolase